jgi:DNA-binding response OmpR family regulator
MKNKMLIVDDEEDILIFLSHHFNKNGFDVTTSLDGSIGLSEFKKIYVCQIWMV